MKSSAATSTLAKSAALYAPEASAPGRRHSSALLHLIFSFGLLGLFLVAIVDSSFVPLPIPGLTDIMIIIMAAQHHNWLLLILIAAAGSLVGGYFSYQVGASGGMAFIEKRLSARNSKLVRDWMEHHNILSVVLPALLPPPMPLAPFVLAAGVIKVSRKKFLTTFTLSRLVRHSIAAWLGIHYGSHILHLWNHLSAQYATPILIAIWISIAASCAFGGWKLYKASRTLGIYPPSHPNTMV
ncbi:YqaA family protein [Edaphobacter sp.]|uniref:YqaA family protein n=1 Tax=Edaphobacter sp. TaxID=1934404 RepID=UPI002DB828B5|nr:VTT domain-containing protein [Edaphobacter sp.]HEU5341927.1 VTT domain-containing protein [Edaphobacter sp.]